jgi:GntR family transcriptional regulator
MTTTLTPATVYHQSVPLHHQIERVLRAKIDSGEWSAGERIPTEVELLTRFKVSRTTIREALRGLKSEGVLVAQGRYGTFVREATPRPRATPTITNRVYGYDTTVRVVRAEVVPAPAHVAAFLGVERGAPVRRFLRVETLDDVPIAAIDNDMPLPLGERHRERDLWHHSMLDILRDKLGVRLGTIRQQIEACTPDDEIASLLAIDLTRPVLSSRLLVSDRRGHPVQIAHTVYRADRCRYELDIPGVGEGPTRHPTLVGPRLRRE